MSGFFSAIFIDPILQQSEFRGAGLQNRPLGTSSLAPGTQSPAAGSGGGGPGGGFFFRKETPATILAAAATPERARALRAALEACVEASDAALRDAAGTTLEEAAHLDHLVETIEFEPAKVRRFFSFYFSPFYLISSFSVLIV